MSLFIKMAYILNDPHIFGITLNPFLNYSLSVDTLFETDSFFAVSWVISKGLPNEKFTTNAAGKGNLKLLQYLHRKGCLWDETTCEKAARNGHLDCLKYLHEEGCPWNDRACIWAAKYGHLECLKYAHKNGCPWHEWVTLLAIKHGHLDCLSYAVENGCQLIITDSILYRTYSLYPDIFKYLIECVQINLG